jgi:hypothetical protein
MALPAQNLFTMLTTKFKLQISCYTVRKLIGSLATQSSPPGLVYLVVNINRLFED